MDKVEFLVDRIKYVNKIHLSLLLVCSIAISYSLGIFTKTELEKEVDKIKEVIRGAPQKTIRDFYLLRIHEKESLLKEQILNEFGVDAIIWKEEIIQDQYIIKNIYPDNSLITKASIGETTIRELFNILQDTIVAIQYPQKLYDCKIETQGTKEGFDYPRTDIPKMINLSKDNNGYLSIKIIEKFSSPNQLITSKGSRTGFRTLICKCETRIDTTPLFTSATLEINFPNIFSNLNEFENLSADQLLSRETIELKEISLKKEVNVLGVSVNLRNIAIAVSFIVLGLLLFLLASITDIRNKIEISSKEIIEIDFHKGYWVGLMGNKPSLFFSVLTLMIFPLSSTILSITTFTKNPIFPIFTGILIFSLSSLILSESSKINELINKNKEAANK